MGLDIRIDHEIGKLTEFLDGARTKALPAATRKALNKTLEVTRSEMNRVFRAHRKIKIGELKSRFQTVKKARGKVIAAMTAEAIPSTRPVSLIRFVSGSKEPRNQKGIKVSRRRKIRTEVRPGRKIVRQHLFIARGRGGVNQVFQRMGKKRFPIGKRTIPPFSKLFIRLGLDKALTSFASARWSTEWDRAVRLEFERVKKK